MMQNLHMFHFTEESRSIFVKVPLQGEPMYHSVNARELTMLKVVSIEHLDAKMYSSRWNSVTLQEALPKLQTFLDTKVWLDKAVRAGEAN